MSESNEMSGTSPLGRFVMWFVPTYEIIEEFMGGDKYWMIYQKQFGLKRFYERWNTPETAKIRLKELTCGPREDKMLPPNEVPNTLQTPDSRRDSKSELNDLLNGHADGRQLNNVDKIILSKLIELRLLVGEKWQDGASKEQGADIEIEVVSDVKKAWSLLEDLKCLEHIWVKDEGAI